MERTVWLLSTPVTTSGRQTKRRGAVRTRLTATITPEKAHTVNVLNDDGTRKTGAQIRDEHFMGALTGADRGIPAWAVLNDTVAAGPGVMQVSPVWQPFADEITAPAGSSLLKSAVDCGAMTVDNTREACMAQVDGEVVLSCMVPVPNDRRTEIEALVCNSDSAWDDMMM